MLIAVVLGLVGLGHVINADVTGTYFAPSNRCTISIKAYGNGDPGSIAGYIKVNGLSYWEAVGSAGRGFNLVTLDPNTCKASNYARFDTYAAAANSDALATYINNLANGTHILGATGDDVTQALQASAKNALKTLGVDVSGMVFHDKALFHAVKGHQEQTVAKLGVANTANLFYEEKPAC